MEKYVWKEYPPTSKRFDLKIILAGWNDVYNPQKIYLLAFLDSYLSVYT